MNKKNENIDCMYLFLCYWIYIETLKNHVLRLTEDIENIMLMD